MSKQSNFGKNMKYLTPTLLTLSMATILTACSSSNGSSSANNQPIKPNNPVQPTTPNYPLAPIQGIDVSGVTSVNLSLPIGWESSNQSLIKSDLANVGSDSRISADIANQINVVKKAKADLTSLESTKKLADNVTNELEKLKNTAYPQPTKTINFTGTTTSELAKLIANNTKIIINQPISVDSVVRLSSHENVQIECQNNATFTGQERYEAVPSYRPNFLANQGVVNQTVSAFDIQNSQYTQISGCNFINTQAVIANNSKFLTLNRLNIKDSKGYGIILAKNNQNIMVNNSTLSNNYGGILVLSNNKQLLVSNNQITQGTGYSAWQSGIVITDKKPQKDIGQTDFLFDQDYLMPALTTGNTETSSSDVYLIKNMVNGQKANGMLIDGAKNIVIANNTVSQNNRDGIALLNVYSSVINSNDVTGNGLVKDVDFAVLNREFPISFRKETDGSYRLRDSGISLDNTAYNLIINNTITNGYGSGIYAKRASFYNVITDNTIRDNNQSQIDNTVLNYQGININAMPQVKASDLVQFAPSMGNVIAKNTITGSHQAGIEFCIYCEDNEVLENTITSPITYSIKQYLPRQQNLFKDNTSNAKSENTNLNANGQGGAKAGSIIMSDWGSGWLNDNVMKNLVASQNNLAGVNNLFMGSSTITLWNLNKNFSGSSVVNRGFGGSTSYDMKVYLKTLLGNSNPKAIFVYVGENDIAGSANTWRTTYHIQQTLAFLQLYRPNAKIIYLGIKPSPSRAKWEQNFLTVSQNMKDFIQNHNMGYIDVAPLVKNVDGSTNTSLFVGDNLHLNDKGYEILANAVRPYLQ